MNPLIEATKWIPDYTEIFVEEINKYPVDQAWDVNSKMEELDGTI